MTTQVELRVVTPFALGGAGYANGDTITDATAVAAVLASSYKRNVLQISGVLAGGPPPTVAGGSGSGLTAAQQAALATAEAQAAAALPSSGGTATGLILSGDPTAALGAATKQYVDGHAGSGGSGAPFTTTTLAATGTTQATAAPLPSVVNTVTSAPAGGGVILPAAPAYAVVVENQTAAVLLVYPPLGAQVNAVGTNLPVQIVAGGSATFTPSSPTQFYSE